MLANHMRNRPGAPPTGAARPTGRQIQRSGCLQIAFIAALVYNLLAFITWFFYAYLLRARCVIRPLCGVDQSGWFAQLALTLGSMIAVGLIVAGGVWLSTRGGASGRLARTINTWEPSAEHWRPLMLVAIILAVLLFATLVSGRATLPLALLGCGDSALLFLAARVGRQAARAAPQSATPLPPVRPAAAPALGAAATSDTTAAPDAAHRVAATSASIRPPAF